MANVPRRPRYLVVALVVTLVFGAGCWTEGCSRIAFYRGERDHVGTMHSAIKDDADRARVEALYQRLLTMAEDARKRVVPFGAATFVLGAAMLAFASRGLAGRSNTRSALIQVVTAQAIIVAIGWFATRDFREAEMDWELERALVQQREMLPPEQTQGSAAAADAMRRLGAPIWLVFRTIASGLVVVALTRQRTREFFESAADAVSER